MRKGNKLKNKKMKKSIILYSGGLDSTTVLYKYKSEIKLAVSFDYGSKHNQKEIEHAVKNCSILNIEHRIIKVDFNAFGFVSDLLKSGGEIPKGHYEDVSMKRTVVPFRNGIMLSIAAGIAESIECNRIIISNHAGDHAIYPDCREAFIKGMNEAIKTGTYNEIEIFAPFTNISKRDIALIGKEIGIDYSLSYSCYKGGNTHCGECGTCTERKEALEGFDNTNYLK